MLRPFEEAVEIVKNYSVKVVYNHTLVDEFNALATEIASGGDLDDPKFDNMMELDIQVDYSDELIKDYEETVLLLRGELIMEVIERGLDIEESPEESLTDMPLDTFVTRVYGKPLPEDMYVVTQEDLAMYCPPMSNEKYLELFGALIDLVEGVSSLDGNDI